MPSNVGVAAGNIDRPSRYKRESLVEQNLWLIRLRWIAAVSIVAAALLSSYVFPVLASAVPIYIFAGVLLLCNIIYYCVATKKPESAGPKETVLGMLQVEVDLVILTAVSSFPSFGSAP